MSVPNQEIIKRAARKPFDAANPFARMHNDAMQEAMNNLKGETFKLWCYLNKNTDSSDFSLELSQKDCEAWGIKKDAYYAAKKKLKELGYLVQKQDDSNIYIFYESLSENPKEKEGFSEKPKEFSENQNNSSEKPKNFSEIPQRNTTDTTYKQQENNKKAEFAASANTASNESPIVSENLPKITMEQALNYWDEFDIIDNILISPEGRKFQLQEA